MGTPRLRSMRCVFVEVSDRRQGQENLCSSDLLEDPATSACRSGIYQPLSFSWNTPLLAKSARRPVLSAVEGWGATSRFLDQGRSDHRSEPSGCRVGSLFEMNFCFSFRSRQHPAARGFL